MRGFQYYIVVVLMMVGGLEVMGKSYYNTAQNGFGGLNAHPGMRMAGRYRAVVDERLGEENATKATDVALDTIDIGSTT